MNIRITSACSLAAALSLSALNPLSAAVVAAKPLSQVAPAYSSDLRAASTEGEVVVSFTITKAGTVANPTVVSSTDRHLEGPTLNAIRNWTFAPAMKDGVAISVRAVQSVAFRIPELHSDASSQLVTANARSAGVL
jgi:TonB family protein